jgi:hypothetical protein
LVILLYLRDVSAGVHDHFLDGVVLAFRSQFFKLGVGELGVVSGSGERGTVSSCSVWCDWREVTYVFWVGLKSQSLMDKEETVVMVRDDFEGQSQAAATTRRHTRASDHHSQRGRDGDSQRGVHRVKCR